MTYGDLIREWMDRRSMSASELARGSGLDPAHVSRVLSCGQTPTAPTMQRLADTLVMDDKARARLLKLVAVPEHGGGGR